MTADELPPETPLLRAIALLLALLGAPFAAWRRFLAWSDRKLELLERTLEILYRRGLRLRYDGESEATAEKRLALVAWFMDDPRKAQRHLGRLHRAGFRIFFRPGNALQYASPACAPKNDARVEDLFTATCAPCDSS